MEHNEQGKEVQDTTTGATTTTTTTSSRKKEKRGKLPAGDSKSGTHSITPELDLRPEVRKIGYVTETCRRYVSFPLGFEKSQNGGHEGL
jgi:hypothetical protein